MPVKPKYPRLYDMEWWKENKERTNVDISEEIGCASSTVAKAREKMSIGPISKSEASKRQWNSLKFRQENAKYPILYTKKFWEENKHKTNSEIAKEVGGSPTIIKSAREFMGYSSLSRSEAQKRRFYRDNKYNNRQEIPERVRKEVIERADEQCEVPGCDVSNGLEVHHIAHNSDDPKYLIVLCFSHHKWMEKTNIEITDYNNAKNKLEKMFPKL